MKACPFCAEQIQDAAVVCKHCGRDLESTRPTPIAEYLGYAVAILANPVATMRSRKTGAKVFLIFVCGLFMLYVIAALLDPGASTTTTTSATTTTTTETRKPPTISPKPTAPRDDNMELFVQRFGPPDTDESSEHETPRPPIVTRLLTYRAERVRATYRADVQFGSPPPYDGKWKLFGFLDPETDAAIRPAVAVQRLAKRDKNRR